MLDKLNHLKDEMCDELMELTDKKNRSPGDVEMIGEIVDIILDIHRIEDYCEGGEYSRAGEWEADMARILRPRIRKRLQPGQQLRQPWPSLCARALLPHGWP